MPRGVKGSKKTVTDRAGELANKRASARKPKEQPAELSMPRSTSAKKPRKAYPSREERVVLADARIERLANLNDTRRAQIQSAEATLSARKAALARGIEELETAIARRERLVVIKDKPAKASKPKLSPEELKALRIENIAKARAAKKKTTKEPKPKLSADEIKAKRIENAAKARAAKKKTSKTPKPKMTPEELKAFRVELMAKARAAKKDKKGSKG